MRLSWWGVSTKIKHGENEGARVHVAYEWMNKEEYFVQVHLWCDRSILEVKRKAQWSGA